ncbi:retrovirus-related Pol polyprotein from transposon TNT 1-94 [Nephila pilipes]|uniref:Retrovirus-related Pol polyprotein from transposon TNT 1-94 n=1 Tax=Nephila pilipes TaxID=299642 RepID=A0A8X6UU17_NEPPI|nr:retrovirus-related Pol polyprotein from transposon TNT 1-94 [Nephila pilipes]
MDLSDRTLFSTPLSPHIEFAQASFNGKSKGCYRESADRAPEAFAVHLVRHFHMVTGNYELLVCGVRKYPSLPAEASAEAIAAYEKAQKAFIKDDSLAQLIRVGNMDDSNAELTAVCKTAKSVWEKLLSVYEQSSGQRLDRLMEKFFRSEKELEDNIASHIAKLQRNFSELNDELRRVAKTTLPDLLLMSRIMSTLPSEYFEFKSVWVSPGHLAKDYIKKESRPKVESDAFVCTVEDVPESQVWIADSGASAHMTKHKNYFVDLTKFISPKLVYVGNSDAIMASGHGTVNIEIRINNKWEIQHLTELWYVPDISRNLFSISQTLKKGFKFQASKEDYSILRDDRVHMKGVRTVNGIYALEMRGIYAPYPEVSAEVCVASADQSLQLWHDRLCHQNKAHVKDILSKYQIKSGVKKTAKYVMGVVIASSVVVPLEQGNKGLHHQENYRRM